MSAPTYTVSIVEEGGKTMKLRNVKMQHIPHGRLLRSWFDYHPGQGCLVWKERSDMPSRWNENNAGLPAGTNIRDPWGTKVIVIAVPHADVGIRYVGRFTHHQLVWRWWFNWAAAGYRVMRLNKGGPFPDRIENLYTIRPDKSHDLAVDRLRALLAKDDEHALAVLGRHAETILNG